MVVVVVVVVVLLVTVEVVVTVVAVTVVSVVVLVSVVVGVVGLHSSQQVCWNEPAKKEGPVSSHTQCGGWKTHLWCRVTSLLMILCTMAFSVWNNLPCQLVRK